MTQKNETEIYCAHIDLKTGRLQFLKDHLEGVAYQAAQFAAEFDSREWGYIAGLFHDLGKYDDSWQDYLRYETPLRLTEYVKRSRPSRVRGLQHVPAAHGYST